MDLAEQVIKYWTIFSQMKSPSSHGSKQHTDPLGGLLQSHGSNHLQHSLKRATFCKDSLNQKNGGDLLLYLKRMEPPLIHLQSLSNRNPRGDKILALFPLGICYRTRLRYIGFQFLIFTNQLEACRPSNKTKNISSL